MRRPLIAGNWKMNTTLVEAVSLVEALRAPLEEIAGVESAVCPPFVSLAAVAEHLKGSSVAVGAQNMYHEDRGAFTGEVSPLMLKGLARYVILGHSERRQHFGETDAGVHRKLQAALRHGLVPILCVGERLEQREEGLTAEVVRAQVRGALAGHDTLGDTVIAYEPVWAIGTGRAATGPDANATIRLIRDTVADLFDRAAADRLRILYGGSVTPDNIREFISQPEIDGGLVGGASLKADDFIRIVQITAEVRA